MHKYRVIVGESLAPWGGYTTHLAVERIDGKEIKGNWDLLQNIKNEYLGEDVTAIEIFPAKLEVVNEVNRRHLWVIPAEMIPSLRRR